MATVECVTAFTDLYHPTVSGVTTTVSLWRDRWRKRGGRMPIVFPEMEGYEPRDEEYPVPSVPAPFYSAYRLGAPIAPEYLEVPGVVHVHTPFTVGLAGVRFASRHDRPLVASYHTFLGPRVDDLFPELGAVGLRRTARSYQRRFFSQADVVVTPTPYARRHLRNDVGIDHDVRVVSNGIDIEFFRPVDPTAFRRRYDLPANGPVIGYTGRHGYEKRLEDLLVAVDGMELTVVLAGDGPARDDLRRRAETVDADVRFPGYLGREALPAFYSAIDAFAFPSPVETQGLVALEAIACGTPVVAVDAGAVRESVIDGETGYRYRQGDVEAFRFALDRTLSERDRLGDRCRRRREVLSVECSIDQLAALYDSLLQ